jgi:hypothetical protein
MPFFFCYTRWHCHHDTWKTSVALWRWCNVKSTSLSLAQNIFEGRTLIGDEQRSGRPSTTRRGDNTARVRELVRSDRRFTVIIIAYEVKMNQVTVRLILTEKLEMRKICAKMVPRNLTEQLRDARWSTVFDIQMHYGDAVASLLTWSRTLRLLFISKSKRGSERTSFWVNRSIQRDVTQALNDIPQTAFQECYKQWQHRWRRCVQVQGMYFEGDHIVVDE